MRPTLAAMGPHPRWPAYLLRLRWQGGHFTVELLELRRSTLHRFEGLRALWRYLRAQAPGLR